MDTPHETKDPVALWLETAEAQALIRRAAGLVLREAKERRLAFSFIGISDGFDVSDDLLREEIASALNLFILENRRNIQQTLRIVGANRGLVLQYTFLQQWLDATRTPKTDRWRYFYKRTVDVLRQAVHIRRKPARRGTLYSLAENNIAIPDPTPEDLEAVPFLDHVLSARTFKALNKACVILALAEHFWKGMSARWEGKAIWVPVRVFVRWTSTHVPLEAGTASDLPRQARVEVDTLAAANTGRETHHLDAGQITQWAERFARTLEQEESIAFALYHGEGRTLAQVAQEMGYRGPSGPSYVIGKATEKLKCFLRDLPGLSPPDVNHEAFCVFVQELLAALKRLRPKP